MPRKSNKLVISKRSAPIATAPAPTPATPPAGGGGPSGPIVGRQAKGKPNKCPVCNKKTKDDTNYYNCKDGVQRCDKCYKDYMNELWKVDKKTGKSGKQKKHNPVGGPRARFIVRFALKRA
jgi:hypothetical protein